MKSEVEASAKNVEHTLLNGYEVPAAQESMYDRIRDFRKSHPEYVLDQTTHLPYSKEDGESTALLNAAPGLGEIVVHTATISNKNQMVLIRASVVQYFHSMFDFGAKALSDAIWYFGEGKGPKHCFEEIQQEDEIIHPAERFRRKREIRRYKEVVRRVKTWQQRDETDQKPSMPTPKLMDLPMWCNRLHEKDQKWVLKKGVKVNLANSFKKDERFNQIPEELQRIGVAGRKTTYTIGDETIEVIEAVETKGASKGCIYRNRYLLANSGFQFNLNNKSKKWAFVIQQAQSDVA